MNHALRTLLVVLALAASPLHAAVVTSCPTNGGGDQVTRGFYVENYAGSTIDQVTLNYFGSASESYTVSLTARVGAFDGPLIKTVTVTTPLSTAESAVTFDFNDAAVPYGSTIAFSQTLVTGTAPLYYDYGAGSLGDPTVVVCAGVFETEGTTPPLSTFRRTSVGVTITGNPNRPVATTAVPTLSEGLTLALACVILAFGGLAIRRRGS